MKSTKHPSRPPSHSEVVVGTKPAEIIEAEWLADLRKMPSLAGRPDGDGWVTVAEMMAQSGASRDVVRHFILTRPAGYWQTVSGGAVVRGHKVRSMYYRKNPNFLPSAE